MPEPKGFSDYLLGPQSGDYPKALYKFAGTQKGDLVSPAYEDIVVNDAGFASRFARRYNYVTVKAANEREEKQFLKDGWVDHPSKITEAA
jgi:hypothetical protein